MQPVRLAPEFHERPWGVDDLAPYFHESRPGVKLGEAWFRADPPIPILPKFLFTAQNLSVQVHPSGACGVGKTEMWRILAAGAGAKIALGFTRPVNPKTLREAAVSGEIEALLRWFPVTAGETYFIAAGTVHAIGAGITICEIQQNSDVTYRLYDYGRPRELHLDQAMAAIDFPAWRHPGPAIPTPLPDRWTRLADCPHFITDSLDLATPLDYRPAPARFELLICIAGSGALNGSPFAAGAVWLLPAGCSPLRIAPEGPVTLLRSFVG